MTFDEINEKIYDEVGRAEKIHPIWPEDVVHGAAILAEETGSAVKAALDYYYGRGGVAKLKEELVHSAAMAIRNLAAL